MAGRYCGNCGHELREDDRFCPGCGRAAHETARAPAPQAGVPVPPLPERQSDRQDEDTDRSTERARNAESTRNAYFALGAVVLVVAFVIALSSGSEGGAVLVVLIGIVAFVVLSGPDRRKGGDGLEILGTGSGRTLSETERLRLLKEKTLEFRVEGEPARILDMVRGYFESEEWPHREISRFRSSLFGTHTRVTCILDRGGNPLGCILWILFAVVSFGLAIALWFLWDMERDDFLPQVVVAAYPDSRGVSRVTVTSGRKPEYAGPVAGWIKRELVERGRAATADTRDFPASVDPTEQIRRLARLRDSGTITEEEFERKKSDLLDRM